MTERPVNNPPKLPLAQQQAVGVVLKATIERWAEVLHGQRLAALELSLCPVPGSFDLLVGMLFAEALFREDPEFMHWLIQAPGLEVNDILGKPLPETIALLKGLVELAIQTIEEAEHA